MKNDPDPYDGPIESLDGTRPYNMYLWPTEDWWANGSVEKYSKVPRYKMIGEYFDSRWNFGIVALKDGRFSVEGSVYSIEKGVDAAGHKVVFDTRSEAIRTAAARIIGEARGSRKWPSGCFGALAGKELEKFINWTLAIVAIECGEKPTTPVRVFEPAPEKKPSGLPLFDFAEAEASA